MFPPCCGENFCAEVLAGQSVTSPAMSLTSEVFLGMSKCQQPFDARFGCKEPETIP